MAEIPGYIYESGHLRMRFSAVRRSGAGSAAQEYGITQDAASARSLRVIRSILLYSLKRV